MDMGDVIRQSGAIGTIAKELGVPESMAQAGAAALLPAILGGFKKQAQTQPSGLDGLGGLLGQLGGGGLLDAVLAPEPTPVERGNDILGQIFGSKDVSRTVAGHAAAQTGLDSSLLKKMLPILAMVVAGYLAKQAGGQSGASAGGGIGGMIGDLIGGALGGGASVAPPAPAGGGLAGSLGGSLGGLGKLIDMDGDGNPLDDIMGMAAKLGR